MKKIIVLLLFFINVVVYGQEKFALIIGNSAYSNFGTLRNPVNDANDMKDVLENLDFTVDIVLNGSLNQMENAAIRLRNRLSEAGNDSIGFFYYAGHGLEMGGVNYLIPADSNIPDRTFLRERAFSVQIMLDMLNDSRNALNIIVLDACRDFPATWSRNLNRGLAVVSNPPANHIIMYATGAGTVANDGIGRNGLFTGHLLNNLKQPYDINEIFRKTMGDVAEASNNQQRPALYTDFAKTMYFNTGIETEWQLSNEPQNNIFETNNTQVIGGRTVLPNGLYFTTGRKVGMGFLNNVLGLGSFLMKDWQGGLIQIGLYSLGAGLTLIPLYSKRGGPVDLLKSPSYWIGASIGLGYIVHGFIRPFYYDKSLAKKNGTYKTVFNPLDNLNIAFIPDKDGVNTVCFLYSINF